MASRPQANSPRYLTNSRPREDGIVAAGVKYVERNFMALRELPDLAAPKHPKQDLGDGRSLPTSPGRYGVPSLERFKLGRGDDAVNTLSMGWAKR